MSDYFPPEVIAEILHRLPLKSLVKCISVCKPWKSLITHQTFISHHLTHTLQSNHGHASSLFLQLYSRRRIECPDFFIYDDILSLYSDNKQLDDRLSVFAHPCPQHFFQNDYSTMVGTCNGLVVRFVTFHNEQYTPEVEIFSLASRSWRSITSRPPKLLHPNYKTFRRPPQMVVNGSLHWVFKRRSSNGEVHNFILSFDVAEETFGEVMLPQCLKESTIVESILVGEELLAVVRRYAVYNLEEEKIFRIWVMKQYGVVESWDEWFPCDLTRYWRKSSVLAIRSSGEILLESWSYGIFLLDPMKEIEKKLGLRKYYEALVGYHVESLFLINEKILQFPTFNDNMDDALEDDDFDDSESLPKAFPSPPHIPPHPSQRGIFRFPKLRGQDFCYLDLEIGLLSDTNDDLDLELRLGTSS
ncbi:F-box/kelch-repeat protein [Senna tora]|uniref:F-box/kelch-repeat protein n=1 Tax=Senna tora TaxID=362788 RepID=A0A834XLC2_9FABA|nr:F-box/kelch-repeat protein [Senna tora]